MKSLLRISFNKFIFSFVPILVWFLLGIIIEGNLANIFALTYPLQFVFLVLFSIFGTAPNINETKDKAKGAAFSGAIIGLFVGALITIFIVLNLDIYVNFMNMDYVACKEFAMFSVVSLYISFALSIIMEKLYFDKKEKRANVYMIIYNAIYILTLIGAALLTKDKMQIVTIAITSLSVYVAYIAMRTFRSYHAKFNFRLWKWFRYESNVIMSNILYFVVYLIGFSNVFSYGPEYATVMNFVALLTDTQWDSFDAISTVAKIDISKNTFNYRKSLKNAYKLLGILLCTILVMFLFTIKFYTINLWLFLAFISFDFYVFLIYPIYALKACYLQIKWSPLVTTSNKMVQMAFRLGCAFIPTPFCTSIGAFLGETYLLIIYSILYRRHGKKLTK